MKLAAAAPACRALPSLFARAFVSNPFTGAACLWIIRRRPTRAAGSGLLRDDSELVVREIWPVARPASGSRAARATLPLSLPRFVSVSFRAINKRAPSRAEPSRVVVVALPTNQASQLARERTNEPDAKGATLAANGGARFGLRNSTGPRFRLVASSRLVSLATTGRRFAGFRSISARQQTANERANECTAEAEAERKTTASE